MSTVPHLDWLVDEEARREFHKTWPVPDVFRDKRSEASFIMGHWDTAEHKFGVMLGLWKPIYPDEVPDY